MLPKFGNELNGSAGAVCAVGTVRAVGTAGGAGATGGVGTIAAVGTAGAAGLAVAGCETRNVNVCAHLPHLAFPVVSDGRGTCNCVEHFGQVNCSRLAIGTLMR